MVTRGPGVANVRDPLPMLWTMKDGVAFSRVLNRELGKAGFAVALTGSVLFKGRSVKDLDLVMFPLTTDRSDIEQQVYPVLVKGLGMQLLHPVSVVHHQWRRLGSVDTKHVEVWETTWPFTSPARRRRVDIFFLR